MQPLRKSHCRGTFFWVANATYLAQEVLRRWGVIKHATLTALDKIPWGALVRVEIGIPMLIKRPLATLRFDRVSKPVMQQARRSRGSIVWV
jgi:hypothetical protein